MSDTRTTPAAGPWVTFRESPPAVRFVLVGVAVNQLGAFLQAFLVLFLVHRGFSDAQAGLALGTYGAGTVIGVLFGGRLTDRLEPRTTIIMSMLGAAATTVTISFLAAYPAILVAVLLAGTMTQAYRPAAATLLTGMVPPSRQVMVMAMNRLALNLGMVIGPLAAAALVSVSWSLIFWVDAATSLAYAAVAVFMLPVARCRGEGGRVDGVRDTTTYRVVLGDRRFVVFLASMFTNAVVHIQALAVLPVTLRDAGYPTVLYSAVLVLGTGLVVTCELLVTRATQRWPAHRAAALGSLLLGVGMLGYGVRGGIVLVVVAAVVNEVGQIIGGPTVFAWPAKAAPDGMAGRYLGSALAMFGLGQAVGSLAGLFAYEQLGRNFWWLCGALGVFSATACRYSMRPQPAGVAEGAAEDAVQLEPSFAA